MKKENLIRLGAIAQKEFNMADEFTIQEVNEERTIRTATLGEGEFVDLHKYNFPNESESICLGYSKVFNTLFIKIG